MTKSCVGITTGNFHPMVLDNFRVTTSLTLLNRRRADIVFGSLNSDDECNATGKLNFRFDSIDGRSDVFVDNVCVVAVAVVIPAVVVADVVVVRGFVNKDTPKLLPYILSGDNIFADDWHSLRSQSNEFDILNEWKSENISLAIKFIAF